MGDLAFALHEISKSFGEVTANSKVSFEVEAGTAHGIVGENGAGKSTIMKILYGLYPPDSGWVEVKGKRENITHPETAIKLGIGMVHQHFMLVPTLSVWQNLSIGTEPGPVLFPKKIKEKLQSLQKEYGFQLDLNARIENLSVGQQQQVEILKLLHRNADILILDEPTAVLTPQEVDQLFTRLKTLLEKGRTIILITHKLKEILRFTQRVTVMRQGRVVDTTHTKELTETSLAEKIIGRKRNSLPERKIFPVDAKVLIEVQDLSLKQPDRESLQKINFSVRSGEILGVAGIEGNGQAAVVECLAGVERGYGGSVRVQGREVSRINPYRLHQLQYALVPPDRHREAAILEFTAEENFSLGHQRERVFQLAGFIRSRSRRDETLKGLQAFDVRPPNPDQRFREFSGGNQQKLVLAREFTREVRTVIASHPTRGVDIGAIERIHAELLMWRDKGAAILLFSSELEEILDLSDRILVLYEGKVAGVCKRSEANERQLGLWMTGGTA